MGNVIEKGGEDNFTALDRIAVHLIDNGVSVPPIQNSGGHYLPAAIISAINSIKVAPTSINASCVATHANESGVFQVFADTLLKINNVEIEGDNVGRTSSANGSSSTTQSGYIVIDGNGNVSRL